MELKLERKNTVDHARAILDRAKTAEHTTARPRYCSRWRRNGRFGAAVPNGGSSDGVWSAIVARVAGSRWWAPIATLVLAIAGTILVTVGQDLDNKADWAWVIVGALVALVGGLIQLAREIGKADELDSASQEAKRLRIAMKDALQPVAELIADMPSKTPKDRTRALDAVAHQAVSALTLLLKDVDRLRAVVYQLDDEGMSYVAYHGRGNTPNPFHKTTERGRLACEMVAEGRTHFEPDISKAPSDAYKGSGNDYQTFISAAICTGDTGFGMLTVDAPNANDLVDTDRQIVCLVADLLAIAFAIADSK